MEVAQRYGVTRQSVHNWVRRYRHKGMAGLVDRSKRPKSCPHRTPARMELKVVKPHLVPKDQEFDIPLVVRAPLSPECAADEEVEEREQHEPPSREGEGLLPVPKANRTGVFEPFRPRGSPSGAGRSSPGRWGSSPAVSSRAGPQKRRKAHYRKWERPFPL
jgi:transposase-like protein